ncbi:MAG: aminotransferase class V-fold PLP-dependent enzyme [Bacilli bacterium]|jgi:glutamate/tyrosine decarboxylase-like PLP-dependent enzyme|nr:aminotransferase class V-fold PLP-dependent enzyme [Bacilli bacterium]
MDKNYEKLLDKTLLFSKEYLNLLENREIFPSKDNLSYLKQIDTKLPIETLNEIEVLNEIHELAKKTTVIQNSGRYFGYVIGSMLPIAHAISWLSDTYNQNNALYHMSLFNAKIEEITQKWLNELLRLDKRCVTGFVSGSTTATLCAISIARNNIYKNNDINKLRIIISEQAHLTIFKALKILGINENIIIKVPCDKDGKIIVSELPKLTCNDIIIIQVGNLNGGANDDINAICSIAQKVKAWVHIDGAFGLWSCMLDEYKNDFIGLEKADSYSLDAHKTLNACYSCGMIICKHKDIFIDTMNYNLQKTNDDKRNNMTYSLEMSKRSRALMVYATIKQLGKNGIINMLEQMSEITKYFASELKKHHLTIVNKVNFNQFMFYYDNDTKTKILLNKINSSGKCYFSSSTFNNHYVIRVSVCSYKTNKNDIDYCINIIKELLV